MSTVTGSRDRFGGQLGGQHEKGLETTLIDPLTRAHSRELLDTLLVEELERAAKAGAECSLFLFDIDYFKSVNDAYGHARGDQVLRDLVERLGDLVRASDVLFRYGGDEFVLLLPGAGKQDAVETALRVVGGVGATPFPGSPPLSVSVSLGLATFPADGADAATLMEVADRRNYLAKRRGRACAVADDAESSGRAVSSSRLIERDSALVSAQAFLIRLEQEGRGALRVTGGRGAGHTRFLEELTRLALLRGLRVVPVRNGDTGPDGDTRAATDPVVDPAVGGGTGTIVVADGEAEAAVATRLVRELTASGAAPPVLGLAFAVPGWTDDPVDLDLPVLDIAELRPWSSPALRVWLRTTLQGEPSQALVNWLLHRSNGLPARVDRELNRLAQRDGLVRDSSGGWSVAPAVLADAGRPASRLPVPLTDLVGRVQETAQVAELLTTRRLVTLVGPGGIGKTRLSLAVTSMMADTFGDGAVFVPLAEARSVETAVFALAKALRVAEVPGHPLLDTVTEYLADRSMLLVLDNFEQVLIAAPMVADLLAAAPALTSLVTSRERLRLSCEHVYGVPPLPLPDLAAIGTRGAAPDGMDAVDAAIARSSALTLFVTRAQAAAYDFALTPDNLRATAELCHRLDGLPLAIELAAARTGQLTPAELLDQLSHRIDPLGDGLRDLPARQRTLQAAIDWSVALLDHDHHQLLIRLGVFTGGVTVAAAAVVCLPGEAAQEDVAAARLARLGEKNLLRRETDAEGRVRYVMLETIRAYAEEHLSTGPDADLLRTRHARHYADFATQAGTELRGPEQGAWLSRIERDYPNLRAAFHWGLKQGDAQTAARLCAGLRKFWTSGRYLSEGREWLDDLLAAPVTLTGIDLAHVLYTAGLLAAYAGEPEPAARLAARSLTEARRLGHGGAIWRALNTLGISALMRGDHEQARQFHTEGLDLARAKGNRSRIAASSGNLAAVALEGDDLDTAHALLTQALTLERESGDTQGTAFALHGLGDVQLARHDPAGARPLFEESLALSRDIGNRLLEARILRGLGLAAEQKGDVAEAARLIGAAVAIGREVREQDEHASALEDLGRVVAVDQPELVVRLVAATDVFREQYQLPRPLTQQSRWEGVLAALRKQLGEERAAAAWAVGRSLPLETVVDEMLLLDVVSRPGQNTPGQNTQNT